MKKIILSLVVLVSLIIQGCVPSLHPLYSADTIIQDNRIEGTWRNKEETWTFKKNGKNSYTGIYEIENESSKDEFEVYIVKLGKDYYLDFSPSGDLSTSDFYKMHLVPAHTFAKINIESKTLQMQPFNPDWLEEQIKNRYIRIKHEMVSDEIVITAPTTDLQKFVIKYSNHSTGKEQFFMEISNWNKID